MAIDGISGTYAASAYTASARRKEQAEESVSVATRQAEDSVSISPEATQKLLEQRAEKAFAGAPATFEEMEEGLGEKQQEIADMMKEAREVSGYEGRVVQTANGALYTVGPYAKYCSDSGAWQWYNQDGTKRDGRPPQDEFDEQLRISSESAKKHMAYLSENDIFEKFRELARDATLLEFGKSDKGFRDDYLSDSSEAIRKNAEKLTNWYDGYSYRSENAHDPGSFYHSAQAAA